MRPAARRLAANSTEPTLVILPARHESGIRSVVQCFRTVDAPTVAVTKRERWDLALPKLASHHSSHRNRPGQSNLYVLVLVLRFTTLVPGLTTLALESCTFLQAPATTSINPINRANLDEIQ